MEYCKKCGYVWKPYNINNRDRPLECPKCKSRDYDKPRVYTKRELINGASDDNNSTN